MFEVILISRSTCLFWLYQTRSSYTKGVVLFRAFFLKSDEGRVMLSVHSHMISSEKMCHCVWLLSCSYHWSEAFKKASADIWTLFKQTLPIMTKHVKRQTFNSLNKTILGEYNAHKKVYGAPVNWMLRCVDKQGTRANCQKQSGVHAFIIRTIL